MNEPNKMQVGGTHYRSEYQHWDLVADAELGYFEGQITKYGTRHRKKNGEEDLRKAVHFLNKLRELAESMGYRPHWRKIRPGLITYYGECNQLVAAEVELVRRMCCWTKPDDLLPVRHLLTAMLGQYYGPNGDEPGPSYANQS
jgi:hypothetical protein